MERNDQQTIEQLFGKLAAVERQSPPRDAQAEAFIRQKITAQPGAPYYLAQTVVMQEQALQAAQARIEELEAQASAASRQSGGLFGGWFGGNEPATTPPSNAVPGVGRSGYSTPGQAMQQPQRGGGGFLAGAAQAAMGVAGGVLLANAVGGIFGADKAQAAAAEPTNDAVGDDGDDSDETMFS